LFGLVSDRVPPKQKNPKSIDDKITPPSILAHRSQMKSKHKNKKRWVGLARLTAETAGSGPLADFVEGLGPGQLVGRQVLAAPALGDVQLALCDRKGRLEVEVIRARGLQARTGSKLLPGKSKRIEQNQHKNQLMSTL
jgi:hypothetical protein